MKRILYAFGILLCVVLAEKLYDTVVPEQSVNASVVVEENLEKVLEHENINSTQCMIDAFFYYGSMYLSDETSHELVDRISRQLGVTSEYEYDRNDTDNGSISELHKPGNQSDVRIVINTVEEEQSENIISQKQYIQIKVTINNSISSGMYYKEKVIEVINSLASDRNAEIVPEEVTKNAVTMSIKGTKEGVIDLSDQRDLAFSIIKGMNAKKVFENIGDHNYSLYGFSDSIDDYVAIGKNKINVNVAYSYDEENNITTVHIASPIVNYDY